ncbi:PfaD family polyunsaturated fatty acid/polyketide biosynthesis protein [Saccharothrix lopnurensis]|uniref:PfaD family polyunsaturated fatty acid/polyketide biosynthesis protein n=1 Tax=Saccharothrix lopnurensis TaxID=1670621 RepID=A0ABW1PA08_9PSEU
MSVPAPPVVAGAGASAFTASAVVDSVRRFREHAHVVTDPAGRRLGVLTGPTPREHVVGSLPPLYPEWLGGRGFCQAHGVRFPYVAGEMANGIATTRLVVALAKSGMLGFFGSAGLDPREVEDAVHELATALPGRANWGANLGHTPGEPELERRVAEVLLRAGVPRISVSAFTDLTPAVVRCAASGLRLDRDGRIVRQTRLLAKVSGLEAAEKFLSPAPAALLRALVGRGDLTEEQARLAARVPVAQDLTVEADSGGRTDNRPLTALLPAVLALRDRHTRRHGHHVRVGAAGGLGTPEAVAAAFALGADYVVTGSVNQVAVEAGVSETAKRMLSRVDIGDVAMAPAADGFELGARLQVTSRGTLFAARAARLEEVYRDHAGLHTLPAAVAARLEHEVFRLPLARVWELTREFWQRRDPAQLVRADRDPKHRMALVFRWYLGSSARWAITGDPDRRTDYQLWCGPALGAFNRWVVGSFLADPGNRTAVQIALNLLEGAAVVTRAHQLRTHGVAVPAAAAVFRPVRLA